MTVLIGSWEFEGPFGSPPGELRDESAILALLECDRGEWELIELFDCCSALECAERLEVSHSARARAALGFAVYYCDDLNPALREGLLEKIEQEIADFSTFDDAEICQDSGASTGSSTRSLVPRPGTLVQEMPPPCASTTSRER